MTSPITVDERSIVFISTNRGSGGSEELWAHAAMRLVQDGFAVAASVIGWRERHGRIVELARSGVDVLHRLEQYPAWKRAWRRTIGEARSSLVIEIEELLAKRRPAITVISDGGPLPPVDLLELCADRNVRFATIGHVYDPAWWFDDVKARRYRDVLPLARRCYFVANIGIRLIEERLGTALKNAEVVRNPFNVDFSAAPAPLPWDERKELRLATVGRLHPASKGQDILFEALATSRWAHRNWRLTLYGEGPMREVLARMAEQLGIAARVEFGGYVSPAEIWSNNHALVMPSRFEGMPIATVEAMLCGRPVLATNVAGQSELIEDGLTGFLVEAPTPSMMSRGLERLWENCDRLEVMGQAAAERIRTLVPPDPARVFATKLKALLQ